MTRRRVLTCLSSLAAAALACGLGASTAAASTTPADGLEYAALGDSYASGVGSPPYRPESGECRRSDQAHPALLAAEQAATAFTFVACSGATIADVRHTQLPAVGPHTDLVTLTVGGNDAGFVPVIVSCAFLSDEACDGALDLAELSVEAVIGPSLRRLFGEVRRSAPHAQVVVTGYPLLFDPSATAPVAGFSPTEQARANAVTARLNDIIERRATRSGFAFADVEGAFTGHGIGAAEPWILPFTVPLDDSFHPTATGQAAGYLPAVRALVAPVQPAPVQP